MAMPSMAGSLGQSWGSRKCFVLKLSQSGQAPADIKWVQGFQEFQRDSLMIKGYLYQKLGQHYTPRSKFQGAIRQNFFLKRTLFIWFQEAFEWQWMVAPTSRNNEGGWLNETFRKETELKNFFRWPNNSKQLERHNRVRGKDWCLRTKSFSVWLNQTILLHGFVHVLIICTFREIRIWVLLFLLGTYFKIIYLFCPFIWSQFPNFENYILASNISL